MFIARVIPTKKPWKTSGTPLPFKSKIGAGNPGYGIGQSDLTGNLPVTEKLHRITALEIIRVLEKAGFALGP
ncbi:MAG: hypothetical protein L7F78_05585 [Syntrophales bacterium LBB04]|nr:hypothetical protein [Syntrophales bacterium LBB04]